MVDRYLAAQDRRPDPPVGRIPGGSNGVPLDAALEPEFDEHSQWRTGPWAWNCDPSHTVEIREFWDVFGGCLAKMPKGIAEAFFMRELDGMAAEEIQEVFGITPANFWKRMRGPARVSSRGNVSNRAGLASKRRRPPRPGKVRSSYEPFAEPVATPEPAL